MNRIFFLIVLLISGCASGPYGSFIKDERSYSPIVSDVLQELDSKYPPAKTNFFMLHKVKDPFGTLFISEMRSKGYAIQEYEEGVELSGISFGYVLDTVEGFYRITLFINGERLSRPYTNESNTVLPSGSWSLSMVFNNERE